MCEKFGSRVRKLWFTCANFWFTCAIFAHVNQIAHVDTFSFTCWYFFAHVNTIISCFTHVEASSVHETELVRTKWL